MKLLEWAKLVTLVSVHFLEIWTSKKAQNPWFLTLLTSKCASRHISVRFFDIWTSKSGQNPSFFTLLTWKFVSRHNGVHFFDMWTSKSGPNPHLCTFLLGNVLRAVTACTFSTSQLPKVVREWCVLYTTTACNFLISHLARWLRTRRFSEPTFRPPRATNHWKNSESRLSYLFANVHLLSSLSFSSLICSLLVFSALTLPTFAFPSVRIVGSLTSKLPSISGSCEYPWDISSRIWYLMYLSVSENVMQHENALVIPPWKDWKWMTIPFKWQSKTCFDHGTYVVHMWESHGLSMVNHQHDSW